MLVLGLPLSQRRTTALEQIGRYALGCLAEATTATDAVARSCRSVCRVAHWCKIFECRRGHARLPVLVHIANDVEQAIGREALVQIDRDHVHVEMHTGNLTGIEQATSKLSCWPWALGFVSRCKPLVPRTGEIAIELKTHQTSDGALLEKSKYPSTYMAQRHLNYATQGSSIHLEG